MEVWGIRYIIVTRQLYSGRENNNQKEKESRGKELGESQFKEGEEKDNHFINN